MSHGRDVSQPASVGRDLSRAVPARGRAILGTPQVLRFLGRRTNSRFNGEVCSRLERRVEGVCVKHHVEENSIKM